MILNGMKLNYFKVGEDISESIFTSRLYSEETYKKYPREIPICTRRVYVVPEGEKGYMSQSYNEYIKGDNRKFYLHGYTIEQLMNEPEQLAKLNNYIRANDYSNSYGELKYHLIELDESSYLVCKKQVEDFTLNTQMKNYLKNYQYSPYNPDYKPEGKYTLIELNGNKKPYVKKMKTLVDCEKYINDHLIISHPFDYSYRADYWYKYIVVYPNGTAKLHYVKTRKYKTTKQTFKEGEVAVYDLHKIALCRWIPV